MKDEALKLALEALVNHEGNYKLSDAGCDRSHKAITAIEQALEATVQEPWEPRDTAHRPGGLPQDFTKHEVDSFGDWSEWVSPNPEKYFMKCCDCGLVHEMQFKVAKYSKGDECEFVADADLQAVFRARRTTPPAQPAPVQSCYCPNCEAMGKELMMLKAHLTEEKKVELATNWFAEDWAITKAVGMLHDYDRLLRKTTPPAAQRQWVGLTDEEIRACIASEKYAFEIVRAAEAKLKEKNT